jgi:hypothetical protein
MSEAKNLQGQTHAKGPEVSSQLFPVVEELNAEALPVSATPTALSDHEYQLNNSSRFTSFAENFASFLLKFTLISAAAFATGAILTINILIDRIDHKSGWLKEVLQFIKETSKYLLK